MPEISRLRKRVVDLERCEDPADDCTCGGCSYARRVYEAEARTESGTP